MKKQSLIWVTQVNKNNKKYEIFLYFDFFEKKGERMKASYMKQSQLSDANTKDKIINNLLT